MDAYFCKPSAPWQKGSVENGNGRLRRFLPLDTDLMQVPEPPVGARPSCRYSHSFEPMTAFGKSI